MVYGEGGMDAVLRELGRLPARICVKDQDFSRKKN